MKDKLTMGQRITKARKNLGLTPLELGVEIGGLTKATIIKWERDMVSPSVPSFMALCDFLKCDPLWLFTGGTTLKKDNKNVRLKKDAAAQIFDILAELQKLYTKAERCMEKVSQLKKK